MEIVSLIISLFALTASVYSVYESRKNNRITSEPYLVAHESEGDTEYSYEITNKGGGPAFFIDAEYFVNLKKVDANKFRESIKEVLQMHGVRFESSIMKLGKETIMAPGETFILAKISIRPEDTEKMKTIPNAVIGIRVKYKSAHGKMKAWVSDERINNI